eukprot:gene16632-biopygen8271
MHPGLRRVLAAGLGCAAVRWGTIGKRRRPGDSKHLFQMPRFGIIRTPQTCGSRGSTGRNDSGRVPGAPRRVEDARTKWKSIPQYPESPDSHTREFPDGIYGNLGAWAAPPPGISGSAVAPSLASRCS